MSAHARYAKGSDFRDIDGCSCRLGVEAALLGDAAPPPAWLAATAEAFAAAQAREVEQRETLETRAGNTHVALLGTQVPTASLSMALTTFTR